MKQFIRSKTIEVSYDFSKKSHYLVIRTLYENIVSYSLKTISTNKMDCFLPTIKVILNDIVMIHYDITNKYTVSKYLFGKIISFHFIISVLNDYVMAVEESYKYNLDLGSIVLDKDYMFFSESDQKLFFTYLPVKNKSKQFLCVSEFLNDLCLSYAFDFNIELLEKIINLTYENEITFEEFKYSLFELENTFLKEQQNIEKSLKEEINDTNKTLKEEINDTKKITEDKQLYEADFDNKEDEMYEEYQSYKQNKIIKTEDNTNKKENKNKIYVAIVQIVFFVIIIVFNKLGFIEVFSDTLLPIVRFVVLVGIISFFDYLIIARLLGSDENELTKKDKEEIEKINKYKYYPYFVEIKRGKKEKNYINKDVFLIGRDDESVDYVCESKLVGKIHAKIIIQDNKYFLKDLNSKNGTTLNDTQLISNVDYEIFNEDVFVLADVKFIFYSVNKD